MVHRGNSGKSECSNEKVEPMTRGTCVFSLVTGGKVGKNPNTPTTNRTYD